MIRALAMLVGVLPLAALAQPIESSLLGGAPEPSVRLEEVGGDVRASFEQALSRYDAEIAAQPHRIAARIARCSFIESFQVDYEYLTFIDDVYERGEQCDEDLLAQFGDHPEVQLWQLGRTYGEERLTVAQGLLAVLDAHGWTPGQRARLYTALAQASEELDIDRRQRQRTADYAERALELDVRADVRLILASYFQEIGDRAAALEALTSPFDGHDPEDNWYLVNKMTALAELGARDAVLTAHAKLAANSTYYDRTEAAAALRAVGEFERAQQELDSGEGPFYGSADERERFALALEHGTAEEAHAAYEQWRDVGWSEDPIGVNRVSLFVAFPGLPWRGRDLLGLLGALAFLAGMIIVACAPLVLVHYRGAINRLRGAVPYTSDGLHLRHAVLGLSVFAFAGVVSLYTAGSVSLFSDVTTPWAVSAEQRQLAKMLLVESLLSIALLAVVAHALRENFANWWSTDWSVGKSILAGAAVGLVFRLPLLLALLAGFDTSLLRVDNSMWQTLTQVDEIYGAAAALWVLSVAAPVGEEFIFRGLLLRASLKHVSFAAANVLQAALFSAAHFDLGAAPFLFAVGLAAGWLARRSGGLLAPMVMHALFNLTAALLITA